METDGRDFATQQVISNDDDVLNQIDWDDFLNSIPDDDVAGFFPSSDSWIGEVEAVLMKDDDENDTVLISDTNRKLYDDFVAEILADSPPGEVVDDAAGDNGGSPVVESEKEKISDNDSCSDRNKDGVDLADPVDKKHIRQLRNRDAAVRSRERKKMYVKDLEMKSKYLEAEVRRLGRLLQCTLAENQALRFSMGGAFGVSPAKQESAVLLLESLLLGSLLWLVGISCLFMSLLSTPMKLATESEGEIVMGNKGTRGLRSKGYIVPMVQAFVKSRRCKSSRTRMRLLPVFLQVSV